MAIRVDDPWARKWLADEQGRAWLEAHDMPRKPTYSPERECTADDPHPILEFSNLRDEQVITETEVRIRGTADAKGGFKEWALDYGHSADPGNWFQVISSRAAVRDGLLSTMDLTGVQNGVIYLRLRIEGPNGAYAEKVIRLVVRLPVPPTEIPPTDRPTEIPPTAIPPTATNIPPTEIPTGTPTSTLIPPTETSVPSPTPTETETPTP